jgi:hypothetical protein
MPYGHDEGNQVVLSVTDKGPFFLQPDPVAAYVSAVQKFLGSTVTGSWDESTHVLWARWVTNVPDEVTTSEGVTKTLPGWAEDPAATANALLKSLSIMEELPEFQGYLGMSGPDWVVEYPEWDSIRDGFYVSFRDHVVNKESEVEPGEDVPVPGAGSPTPTPWYKRPITYVLAGGVLLVGGAIWYARRKG